MIPETKFFRYLLVISLSIFVCVGVGYLTYLCTVDVVSALFNSLLVHTCLVIAYTFTRSLNVLKMFRGDTKSDSY